MMEDVLGKIVITEETLNNWNKLCEKFVADNACSKPSEIPDEQAFVNDDGSLVIFVKIPNSPELKMRVPATDWAWIKKVLL